MQRNLEPDTGMHLLVDRKKVEYDARNEIRRRSLDAYNRLHSIADDIDFVQNVHEKYSAFPLIANLRCGAWYCDSRSAGGTTCHFKSADGHYNGWSFNLRRPNLHIISLIGKAGGICIVDSTRSGKRLPDSLSKTVPIWCSVVNRALQLRGSVHSVDWDVQLYTPPQSVSKQEHAQIESRIHEWAIALAKSTYELPNLGKSIHPIWITPATTAFPDFDEMTPFLPVVCISASRVDEDIRRHGYSYVQGAGDDHENWSQGLTPDIFWKYKDRLLCATEADFPSVLESIVVEARLTLSLGNCQKSPTAIAYIGGILSILKIDDLPASSMRSDDDQATSRKQSVCIIVREDKDMLGSDHRSSIGENGNLWEIRIPTDKKAGERAFKASLPGSLNFIRRHVSEKREVRIACETGNDLSVGIALVALQAFFDDGGALDLERLDQGKTEVTKGTLRMRLHWIIASRPEANPSRATLKRINEFFMSPRRNLG